MPGNWGYLRNEVWEYLTKNYDKNCTVLDVGVGEGFYINLLKDHFKHFDGVEVFEPYIEQFDLKNRYDNIFNVNILDFEFDFYDIIIMGDILEHITVEDAVPLIEKLSKKCKELLVILPFNLEQEIVNDNIYEKHLQPYLDEEKMNELYPQLELIILNGKSLKLRVDVGEKTYYYCAYRKKQNE
jgi:predicted TPR repeat methyltransferase